MAELELIGVTRSFDGVRVLDGLTARIPLEGITFVVGKSGSGKSVLCRLAVGLLRPDAGEVKVFDVRVDKAPERELNHLRARVPYLVQGAALLDWLTVEENVALAARQKVKNGQLGQIVESTLARVGLLELSDRLPPEIGPGARKRTAIARALALSPEFLLLDEPTTGLDKRAAAQVNDCVLQLRREGLGALVVSHDYRSLEAMADRVLVVAGGVAAFFGTRSEFFASKEPHVRALLDAT